MYKNWPLIVALIAGLLGTYFLYNYVKEKERQALQAQMAFKQQQNQLQQLKQELEQLKRRPVSTGNQVIEKVPVIVAKKKIPAGTILREGMVEEKMIPVEAKLSSAAATLDAVLGKMVTVELSPGEQILLNRITSPEVAKQNFIPPGTRLVTINVEQLGLFYFVKPGDKVDIAMLFTLPTSQVVSVGLFSDVEVKAVDGKVRLAEPSAVVTPEGVIKRGEASQVTVPNIDPNRGTLTFALPPKEAAILYMASQLGKIEIFPRAKFDPDKSKIPAITVDAVLQFAMPNIMKRAKEIAAQKKGENAEKMMGIEVIRLRKGKDIEEKQITSAPKGPNAQLIKRLRERIVNQVNGGGGSGADMNPTAVRRIVKEVLQEEAAKVGPREDWGPTGGGVVRSPDEYYSVNMDIKGKKNDFVSKEISKRKNNKE